MTDATAPDARAAVDELRIAAAGPIEPGVSTSDLTLVSRTSLHTVLALLSDNGVMWLAERNEELRDERDALAARVAELEAYARSLTGAVRAAADVGDAMKRIREMPAPSVSAADAGAAFSAAVADRIAALGADAAQDGRSATEAP